jgi:hypothetical protein
MTVSLHYHCAAMVMVLLIASCIALPWVHGDESCQLLKTNELDVLSSQVIGRGCPTDKCGMKPGDGNECTKDSNCCGSFFFSVDDCPRCQGSIFHGLTVIQACRCFYKVELLGTGRCCYGVCHGADTSE